MMQKQTQGFTLIEIAIVLVIIGLLAGGILKGQQMIENAKYKAFVKEIDAIRVAANSFLDKYKYYPGDFPRATQVFSGAGVTIYNGNGDGVIYGGFCGGPEAQPEEPCIVWQHLIAAGFIAGDASIVNANASRPTAVGGIFQSISTGTWGANRITQKILMQSIPGSVAQRLDDEFDDGKASSGSVVCYTGGGMYTVTTCNTADSNDQYQENTTYSVFVDL